jgi:hypothetical protein
VVAILKNLSLSFARVATLLACGKHLHGCIISLRVEVWTHNTSICHLILLECLYQACF